VLGVLRERPDARAPRAPVPGVDAIPDLVRRSGDAGLDVTLRSRGEATTRLSDAMSLAAYRIVQESLTNARRHGAGGRVIVQLGFAAEALSVTVDSDAAASAGPRAAPGRDPGPGDRLARDGGAGPGAGAGPGRDAGPAGTGPAGG